MYGGAGRYILILEAVLFHWNFPPFALENFDPRFISCTWHCGWKNSTHEFGEGRHTATAVAIQLTVVSLYNWSQAKLRQCWYMDPSVRLNKEQWDHFYGGRRKNVFLTVGNGLSLGTLDSASASFWLACRSLYLELCHGFILDQHSCFRDVSRLLGPLFNL